jgi:hypothetical protein
MLHHYRKNVENDLVDFVIVDDSEYEEIIEEYEVEIFMPEKFLEPPVTDTTDTAPTHDKPRWITRIFDKQYIYVVHLHCRNFMISTCIFISTYESY